MAAPTEIGITADNDFDAAVKAIKKYGDKYGWTIRYVSVFLIEPEEEEEEYEEI